MPAIKLNPNKQYFVNVRWLDTTGPATGKVYIDNIGGGGGTSGISGTSGVSGQSYSFSVNRTTFHIGQTLRFRVNTVNVPDSTRIYFTYSGSAVSKLQSKPAFGSVSTFGTPNGTSGQVITSFDNVAGESFIIQARTGSETGPIVATSPTILLEGYINFPDYFVPVQEILNIVPPPLPPTYTGDQYLIYQALLPRTYGSSPQDTYNRELTLGLSPIYAAWRNALPPSTASYGARPPATGPNDVVWVHQATQLAIQWIIDNND